MSGPASREAGARPGVYLHVERVVIDGPPLAAEERRQFEQALHGELARLLAVSDPRRWLSVGAAASLSAPTVMTPARSPAKLARQVARSVIASLDAGTA